MFRIDRKYLSAIDWILLANLFLIPFCGLIVLYSAGYDPEGRIFTIPLFSIQIPSLAFVRQLLFLSVGTVVFIVSALLPSSFLQKISYIAYGGCVLLLVALLGFGAVSKGARRWFDFGFFKLQPAELMKLGVILALSRYLSRHIPPKGGYTFAQIIVPGLLVGIPMALIMKQPDLGTALSVGAIGGAMILFMGIQKRVLLILVLAAAIAIPSGWHFLHDYQKRRVLVLLDPDSDPLGSGYHIIQSKIAVGSGGITGKGYLEGTQSQLEFLPEHTTDFVFSVLAEEFGFLGGVVVLMLYAHLVYRILRVASRTREISESLVVFGVVSVIFFHAAINVGMVVGIFPVVGIPLPLFSYGGSSVLSTLFEMGLVVGIGMRRFTYTGKGG